MTKIVAFVLGCFLGGIVVSVAAFIGVTLPVVVVSVGIGGILAWNA